MRRCSVNMYQVPGRFCNISWYYRMVMKDLHHDLKTYTHLWTLWVFVVLENSEVAFAEF